MGGEKKLSHCAHFTDKETETQRGRSELRVCVLLQAWAPNTPASARNHFFLPKPVPHGALGIQKGTRCPF